ncbi:hypothetical protein EMIHUDRAFT_104162 [Emiliania huxleyi CCMP1516]|uniref:Poly(A) RNA polymerase mitochondrial-like central palm domain-containing protein n=2 Tax=Emiliania huxleyi TaxID=2903 RepID=A0A0D3IN20_EMIH1|nr:hypothetical protein EMIHUDRAFT_104162 [Emiliania huxleyi CCMP1516]EOD12655.1 hypothetical protein EMIHUDRAFT_104162 [Emiliania huxleyi CCMP1516]|eukprot:XP_005765084.1 hypothetical protein EMIHUDRAFT_104162 [Emiliania huxleyi CCMP1516]
MPAALCFTLVSAMSAVAAVLSAALCAPWYSRLLLLRISSRTRTASCSLFWLADMHPKFHASSSFVTSIFLQYLANAVRACWGVIAFGSALVPALYPIFLRWLLYESPYDHAQQLREQGMRNLRAAGGAVVAIKRMEDGAHGSSSATEAAAGQRTPIWCGRALEARARLEPPSGYARDRRDKIFSRTVPQLDHFCRSWLASAPPQLVAQNAARLHSPAPLVLAYGSATSLLGSSASDIDLTVLLELPPELQRRLLSDIADAFGSVPGVTATAVLAARVPICTMTFPSDWSSPAGAPLVLTSDLVVDVSVGNVIALDNTRLIRTYMEVDECAWQLCLLVKAWARARRVCSARHCFPSSYAWSLLAICHLQHLGQLPNLQGLAPPWALVANTARTPDGRAVSYSFCGNAAAARKFWKAAPLPAPRLPLLLTNFFDTALQLLSDRSPAGLALAACVSAGGLQPLSSCPCFDPRAAQHFAIEDPLEPTRDLGGMVTASTLAILRTELCRARDLLREAVATRSLPEARRWIERLLAAAGGEAGSGEAIGTAIAAAAATAANSGAGGEAASEVAGGAGGSEGGGEGGELVTKMGALLVGASRADVEEALTHCGTVHVDGDTVVASGPPTVSR